MGVKVAKFVLLGLALIITTGIYVFLFQKINFFDALNLIKEADAKILLLAFAISIFINFFISTNRWKIILKSLGHYLSFKEILLIKMGANPLISLFPMKSGELSRVLYLKHALGIPYSQATVSIIVEYMLNFIAAICFILLGIAIYLYQGSNYRASAQISCLFFSYILLKPNFLKNLLNKFLNSQRILLKNCFREFRIILSNKSIFFYTFLFAFANMLNIYLLSRALYKPIPLYGIFIFFPIVQLMTSLRITIAGLGVREMAIVFFFSKFASPETLLSLGILYSIVDHVFPAVIGTSAITVFMKRILKSKIL